MYKLQEENVSIAGQVTLKGTVTVPEGIGDCPAILFIHGSGPTNRDENVKGMEINTFKHLSEAVAPLGFVTLRYDKRGVGESGGNFLAAGLWDLVNDAEAALNFLRRHPAVDRKRIILLGHSEGCAIAPALNKRQPVQGLILLAGAAESLKETVKRQAEMIAKELEAAKGFKGTLFRILKLGDKVKKSQEKTFEKIMASKDDVIRIQFQKINAKWMREHFTYNVVNDLVNVTCPTLAITGSKDIQVLPEHAKSLAELTKGQSEYYIIENMNHLLRKQTGPVSMLRIKKDYKASIKKKIEPELIEKITSWLKRYYLQNNNENIKDNE